MLVKPQYRSIYKSYRQRVVGLRKELLKKKRESVVKRFKRWSYSTSEGDVEAQRLLRRRWFFFFVTGRIVWSRQVGGSCRVGVFGKYGKQFVYSVLLLDARNVVFVGVVYKYRQKFKVSKKVISNIFFDRIEYLRKKVFPIRRMHRKFKKVK